MRRYHFLKQEDIFEAFNKVRDAFLAAKDGDEVNKIIDGILTHDEKLKVGRRILIARHLTSGLTTDAIARQLKVGKNTVMHVSRRIEEHKDCFDLIERRTKAVRKEYESKKYQSVGGSQMIHKRKEYTGFKRKHVKRK